MLSAKSIYKKTTNRAAGHEGQGRMGGRGRGREKRREKRGSDERVFSCDGPCRVLLVGLRSPSRPGGFSSAGICTTVRSAVCWHALHVSQTCSGQTSFLVSAGRRHRHMPLDLQTCLLSAVYPLLLALSSCPPAPAQFPGSPISPRLLPRKA